MVKIQDGPSLFDAAGELEPTAAPLEPGEGETLQERFESFHDRNPWVYAHLVRLARQWRTRSDQRIGVGMLFEVLRWQYQLGTEDASGFKLNNNFRSRYARLIMATEPDLADVFELRALQSP